MAKQRDYDATNTSNRASTLSRRSRRSRAVLRELMGLIRRQHRPGDRLPTEKELTRRLDASLWSVQKAMGELVRLGWVHRRRKSGTFVSDKPPGPPGRFIQLLSGVPSEVLESLQFAAQFLAGAALAAAGGDVRLGILTPEGRVPTRRLGLVLEEKSAARADAIVAFEHTDLSPLNRIPLHVPVVAVEYLPGQGRISSVDFDQADGVRQALGHLVERGHRHIGYLGHTYVVGSPELADPRYQAYVETMRRLGLPLRQAWTLDARSASASAMVDRLVELPGDARPTAVVTRGSTWPILAQLQSRGVTPGRDLAVVALEQMQPWDAWLEQMHRAAEAVEWIQRALRTMPSSEPLTRDLRRLDVTCTRGQAQLLGRRAVEEVLRRWADPTAKPADIRIPLSLHVGNTTSGAVD